jgi:predicted HTH transcriptional regulator
MRAQFFCPKICGDNDPQLIEGDEFKMIIGVPEFEEEDAGQGSPITPEKTPVETPVKTPDLILKTLKNRPELTQAEVSQIIGKSTSAVERACVKLVKEGKLRYVGPKKGGHWEVML